MKKIFICMLAILTLQSFLKAELVVYLDPTNAVTSSVYSLTVEGTPVQVRDYMDYHYAQFAFEGTAELTIEASEDINSFRISPLSLELEGQASGKELKFSMSQVSGADCTPRHLVIKINNLEELIILTDPIETDAPESGGPGIFNVVSDFNADNTGASQTQPAIQAAIDAASSYGTASRKGVVYVPAGLYMIHESLQVKSYVDLYLAPGAVLKSDENEDHYDTSDGTIEPALSIDNANDVIIRGRGEVDASGLALMDPVGGQLTNQSPDHPRRRNIRARYSNNVTIKDIIAKDATGWSVEMLLSDNVNIQNIKVLNHRNVWYKIQNDGINNVSCDDMTVNQCFVITIDDAQCFKARYPEDGPMENGLFSNCVLWNQSAGIKCGMQNDHEMKNVEFRNIDIVHCRRAIAFDTKTGEPPAPITGAVFYDIRCEELEGNFSIPNTYVTEFYTQTAPVSNITISNFTCNDTAPIKFYGNYSVSNVTFNNLVVNGKPITRESDINIIKEIPVSNLVFNSGPAVELEASNGHEMSPFMVKAIFTEDVTGLDAADFVLSNGIVRSVTGGPVEYWLTVAPLGSGVVTLFLPANTVVDSESNGNYQSSMLKITESALNALPDVSGASLYLHLEADSVDAENGASVTSWADSVSGYEFTGTASYKSDFNNGHAALYFDGIDDHLVNRSLAGGPDPADATLFIVGNYTTAAVKSVHEYMVSAQWPEGGSNNRFRFLKQRDDADYEVRIGSGSSISKPSVDAEKHVFAIVSGQRGNSVDFFIDGNLIGSTNSGSSTIPIQALGLGSYHRGNDGAGSNFADCSIAEVVLYDSALSSSDMTNVQNYLRDKYFIYSKVNAPADFNNDAAVNLADWSILSNAWLKDSSSDGFSSQYDISYPSDGIIDNGDLNIFMSQWLIGAE